MRAGDANDDNIITALDFNILKGSYGMGIGDPYYDDRADFNRDTTVNAVDFSLLKASFSQAGSALVCP